ncbi:valacyclovir hydrolase-like [Discoglossus pictus]
MAQCCAGVCLRPSTIFLRLANLHPKPAASYCTSITAGRVQVNGVNLHYQRTGRGDHAVLLLPGTLGSSQIHFGPQLKSLNKEMFTVVGWDPRGYGRSIPPQRDFPLDFFERDAKDAIDLMLALKFKRFSLLGWSYGGTTALVAAGRYPKLIQSLIVLGATVYLADEEIENLEAIKDISNWSEELRKPMEDLYENEYVARTCKRCFDAIQKLKSHCQGNICRNLLPYIECPTLIVHGLKDELVRPVQSQYLHEQIKGSRLQLVPDGKHNLHLRHPEEFNRLVEDFLK